ncbi:MAG: class I SAM-dependent methyltransferase [Mucilaginibacter sp.]
MTHDATLRFSNRVANYTKYRPGYPPQVLDYLQKQCQLSQGSVVADVGSGTGIFTRLLLGRGYTVNGVEPNEPMRREAEKQLQNQPGFHSINGTAESTTLPAKSAELIVCAQAFHWFNTPETKIEFKRILAPHGHVALIWNNRCIDADDFAIAYEILLKQVSGDYERINHQNLTETDFANFFRDGKYHFIKFPNYQVFNLEQLTGRAFSSSYLPAQDSEAGHSLSLMLRALFDQYQTNGTVMFQYDTEIYLGKV